MKKTPRKDVLCQHWMHSHEEDTETEMVYRPVTFAFPPSRGRTGLELKPDNSVVGIGIGATDVPAETIGKWWTEDENEPSIRVEYESGASQVLHIKSADKDRLVIKKIR